MGRDRPPKASPLGPLICAIGRCCRRSGSSSGCKLGRKNKGRPRPPTCAATCRYRAGARGSGTLVRVRTAATIRLVGGFVAASLFLQSTGGAENRKPVAVTPTGSEGHRLFQAGRFAEAAAKLHAESLSSKDPEVLFELAVCDERTGKDVEALDAFRKYLNSPLALRIQEAEQHVSAIESRQSGRGAAAESGPGPRRVVVPISPDHGKCASDCRAPGMCRGYPGDRTQLQCSQVQFSCLRGCPGARVESGSCLATEVRSSTECMTERRSIEMIPKSRPNN